MNLAPFIGFWFRQGKTIKSFAGTDHTGLKLFIDLVHANINIVKQFWPDLNKNGLLDDFMKTLDEAAYQTLIEVEGDDDDEHTI